ncbi:class I SAM-dependent methyltransferase [Flavobacterium sp.]|uniref:class I SAM-dependent methyltransferase n=1 Tax=Flavobacterium sp. TaxID=239 RepID=UPI003752D2E5
MEKKWTGERLETFINSRETIEHLHRYALASEYIKDKVVLDIACVEGYGSNLMIKKASYIYSVDIDEETMQVAKHKYKKSNLEFLTGSTSSIPLANNSIDVVVSFETIEHHDEHDEMVKEIKRVLKPNGLLIISTPDKLYASDSNEHHNEFHIKELYKHEFKDLISKNFDNVQLISQTYFSGSSLIDNESDKDQLQIYSGNFFEIESHTINPLYLIAIASDDNFLLQNKSIFEGSKILNIHIENQIKSIYNSNSYRLGNYILLPLKFIKKLMGLFLYNRFLSKDFIN